MWLETMTWRPSSPHCAEQGDGFGARHGVEAVERLVEHEHLRIVRDGLGQLDALPHALAVGGHGAVGGLGHADAFERGARCARSHFGVAHAVHQQEGVDELVAGEPLGKGVELGAVAEHAAELFGMVGRDAEHADLALAWGGCRPVIRFMSVVLPEPFGPTRLVMPGGMVRLTLLMPSTSP